MCVLHSLEFCCIAQLSFVCVSHLNNVVSHALHFGTVRFINYDDLHWFDRTVSRVVGEELTEELVETVQHSANFVDFMRYKGILLYSKQPQSKLCLVYSSSHPVYMINK